MLAGVVCSLNMFLIVIDEIRLILHVVPRYHKETKDDDYNKNKRKLYL